MEAQWPRPPPTLWAAVFVSVEKTFEDDNIWVSESKSPKKFVKNSSKPLLSNRPLYGIEETSELGSVDKLESLETFNFHSENTFHSLEKTEQSSRATKGN